MARVVLNAAVSLDGFVADPSDAVGPLFDYYNNGPDAITLGDTARVFHVTPPTAEYLGRVADRVGCCVIGRRLFDLTNGWGGRPASGDAVFVVTHEPPKDWPFPDAPFTFVTGGVAEAVGLACDHAGRRDVAVTAGDIGGQALEAGLVDEIHLNLVPVVLGAGVRFFGAYGGGPISFSDPEVLEGHRVTHLIFRRPA
jgi:dihydrofolate reductase